ncbi:MAG: hypothetical protein GF355_00180 [Candidatus Eisenbacteria bacterium]|nr:hypothetical protein [Candidatus Eisenbacteria bacterium]
MARSGSGGHSENRMLRGTAAHALGAGQRGGQGSRRLPGRRYHAAPDQARAEDGPGGGGQHALDRHPGAPPAVLLLRHHRCRRYLPAPFSRRRDDMVAGIRDVRGVTAAPLWHDRPAILHLDIDAFFAAVEQIRNPRLRGRPVIVGTGVIASCSYEARRFGLTAGMPLSQARRLCPEAVVLPGQAQTYRCFAERIFGLAAELAPGVETYLDEAYVDLTGTGAVHGDFLSAARHLRAAARRETGLAVSTGLGTSRMIAKMVTRRVKPDGIGFLAPGAESDFMETLPAGEVPGVGHTIGRLLARLGVRTVRDLRCVPEPALRELLGPAGRWLHERAWGRDTRPVTRREVPGSIRRETSLEQATIDESALVGLLHYLCERALLEVRRQGLAARRLQVFVHYADGPGEKRGSRLSAPSAAQEPIFESARLLLLPLLRRRAAVLRLGLELSGFGFSAGEQQSLLDCGNGRDPGAGIDLDRSIDGVRGRFGFSAVVRGPSLELLERLPRDAHGYVLRTPCLTR